VIPVAEPQAFPRAHLNRVLRAIGRQPNRQARRPPLDADEGDVVERPLVAAPPFRIDLLKPGHGQVAATFDPESHAEGIGAIECADIAEAHLGVAVE
jgi:hypothetical protein